MKGNHPTSLGLSAGRDALRATVAKLLTSSLLLYLVAVAAHRAWLLLNSDVMQLMRRAH